MQVSWIIGGADSCDIQIESPYVSGRHCRLEKTDAGWILEDLGSTNGTFVNDVQLHGPTAVSRSDRITLGRSTPFPWPAEPASNLLARPLPSSDPKHLRLPQLGQTFILGRSHDCDVVLNFPMVSSHHASIQHTPGGWLVTDLGSTNGTFVGSRRIAAEAVVRPGDVIGLGSYRLTVARDERSLDEEDRRGTAPIEVSHLAVDVAGRRLLADVSLVAHPGEMIGVMGASGAGKSTLLAAIVGDLPTVEGRVTIAGVDCQRQRDQLRGQVGYVPQDDIMHADLTVEQALWYSARLRLPRDYGDDEIKSRVEAVIDQLGLSGTENIRIGSAARRGISGGQRKRLNVAMEMITDPPVLILDEPTSGLSSVDALTLMQLLRKLADAGKTIILTIHQPSSEILKLLNAVAVMARDDSTNGTGRLVWYGPAYPAAAFFEPHSTGQRSGSDAEAILRGLTTRPAAHWEALYKSSSSYRDWVTSRLTPNTASPEAAIQPKTLSLAEIGHQCITLVHRMLAVKMADRWNTVMLLAQAPAIALLIAGVFGEKASAQLSVASWESVTSSIAMATFLIALAAVWFGCSNATRELVDERAIYRRERMVGLSPLAYLGSKVGVLGLICVLQCAILLATGIWACGLSGNWIYSFGVMMLAAGAGTVIGLSVSAAVNTPETAAASLPIVVLPLVVLGGILLPLADMSYAFGLVADLMPSRWAFEALLSNEADSRALLQVPDPMKPWVSRFQDIADPWFPSAGWRSKPITPLLVLATMVVLILGSVYSRLTRKPS